MEESMKKLWRILNNLEEIIASSLFAVMCIMVLSQMIARIFLRKGLMFSEEVSRFCYIWVVFLCISLGEKTFEHFNVSVFLIWLKGVPNQIIYAITDFICFFIHAYLLYWSWQFFEFEKVVKSAALEIPMAVVAAGMVLGFFLGSIRCLVNVVHTVQKIGKIKEEKEG
jgi:hypothetical protein